jgi:SagB-type dehydrogenase family enzyme
VEHALVRLHDGEALAREDYGEVNRPVFDEAAFALLLVARPQILEPIYGELGWRFVQIEAGAMGQLLMMAAPEEGVGLCPIGNVDFARVRDRFAASEEARCVHSFLGGRVAGAVTVAEEAPVADLPAAQWPAGLPASTAMAGDSQLPPAIARLELQMSRPGVRRDLHDRTALPLARPPLDGAHVAAYAFRRSHRQLLPSDVSPEQLGGLLGALRQFQPPGRPLPRALYPSAGNLYPVQVYVHLKADRVPGMRGGIYYYHPKEHRLVLLEEGVEIGAALHAETNRAAADTAAFTLLLIGDLRAIEPIYGPLALDFCHLEAGYMLQLLMTLSPAHRLGLCPIGRLRFDEVRESFHLSDRHVLLHTLAGGPVAGPAVALWPAVRLAAAAQEEEAPAGALADDLRAFLRTQLPPYMVPASLVLLSSLPLTSNGKVDRKALPDPDVAASRQTPGTEGPAAPETEMESTLLEIFREVLGSERRIGIADNFFDLGGTSLHLVRVHGRLQQMLGRELPLLQIFNHPTIRLLAQFLGTIGRAGEEPAPFRLDEERVERLRGGTDLLRRRLAQRRTEMEAE